MKELLVVFRDSKYRERVLPVIEAIKVSGERLIIDDKAETWSFVDKKFARLGTFKLGKGPTNEQTESFRIHPKTQTVIDRMNKEHLEEAFAFISSKAFGSGYQIGGAIDAD